VIEIDSQTANTTQKAITHAAVPLLRERDEFNNQT
jgi:hypothetical protein